MLMKNFCITFFVFIIIIATAVFVAARSEDGAAHAENSDYLRIHVRANSNSESDQSVKYIVKDAVVEFITPYAAQCRTKAEATEVISSVTDGIEDVCERVLRENGYSYGAHAEIRRETFPTRVYGDLTLESGVYDALIVELGTGTGDNWWCVLYPPLCFSYAEQDVEYRSLILDIIADFFS